LVIKTNKLKVYTKSTTEAVYALLMQNYRLVERKDNTIIKVGKILTKNGLPTKKSRSRLFKNSWKANEITKNIFVSMKQI
jgi:hypothetical protein